jgi:type VI secretion system protein ImpA
LQEHCWEGLYPEIEEGDLELRAAPLVWLNEKLPLAIRQVPITQGMGGEHYSWLHWRESRDVDNLGRQDQEAMAAALADGKITGEQFDKSVESTPLAHYRTLLDDLNQVGQEYDQLDQVVEENFGRQAPTLLEIKQAIEDCRLLIADIVKKKGGLEPEPPAPAPEAKAERGFFGRLLRGSEEQPSLERQSAPQSAMVDQPQAVLSLMPQDRADAIRRLAAVAEYFRRTEPHSPVAYLVQRAVRWGEMPLEAWLQEVIHDEGVLGQVRETLGLKDADSNA